MTRYFACTLIEVRCAGYAIRKSIHQTISPRLKKKTIEGGPLCSVRLRKGTVQVQKKSILLLIVWQLYIEQLLFEIETQNLFVLMFFFVRRILIGLP